LTQIKRCLRVRSYGAASLTDSPRRAAVPEPAGKPTARGFWTPFSASLTAAVVTTTGIYVIRRFEARSRHNTTYFACFASGVLISVSFLYIIPTAFSMSPEVGVIHPIKRIQPSDRVEACSSTCLTYINGLGVGSHYK
jgi:hypothetical protein